MKVKPLSLLFVHGYLGSALNWGPLINYLKARKELEGCSFHAVDLLWHGRRHGPDEAEKFNLDTMVEDVEEQIRDIGNFVGIGHSFGLQPLLRLSQRSPERLMGLIAEDSCPELSSQGTQNLFKILSQTPVPFADREAAKKYFEDTFVGQVAMSSFLLSNIIPQNGSYTWRFQQHALEGLLRSVLNGPGLWREWQDYAGPAAMIMGETPSSFVSDEQVKKCQELKIQGEFSSQRLQGSGHWVHSDQKELFAESLIRFLILHFKI